MAVMSLLTFPAYAKPVEVQTTAQVNSATAESDLPGGAVERIVTNDGMIVLMQSVDSLPCASVAVRVPVGSLADPATRAGLTQLLAQLQNRSPLGYPNGSLLVQLESIGAKSGYRVFPQSTVFYETVPNQHLNWLLQMSLERAKSGKWPSGEVQHQAKLLIDSWNRVSQQPQKLQHLRLNSALEGVALSGQMAPFKPIELEQHALQVWNWDQSAPQQNPQKAVVVSIVGGFSPASVRDFLQKQGRLDKQSRGSNADPFGAPLSVQKPKVKLATPLAITQAGGKSVEWTFRLPDSADQLAALTIIDASFRGRPGWTTQLSFEENTYSISVSTNDKTSLEAEAEIRNQLSGAVLKLSDPEVLKTCQSLALRRFYRHFDDIQQRALQLACNEGFEQSNRLAAYPGKIRSLTAAQLAELAPQFLQPSLAAKCTPVAVVADGLTPESAPESESSNEGTGSSRRAKLAASPNYSLKTTTAPAFNRLEMDKGITILVQTVRDLPTVSVRGFVNGGSGLDTASLAGRSELLTASLEQRVFNHPLWPDSALDLRLGTASNYISIEGWTPKDALDDWFEILTTALSPQAISQQDLDAARVIQNTKWISEATEPDTMAYQKWLSLLYSADHPYGRSGLDTKVSADQLTLTNINQHWAKVCRPNRLVLAFSGDVSLSEVANKFSSRIPRLAAPDESAGRFELATARNVTATTREKLLSKTSGSLLLTGTLAPQRKDPDYYAFSLLNQILGGPSVTSRLSLRLKNRDHLASSIQSRFLSGSGPQPMLISARVVPGQVEAAYAAIEEEVERLRKEPVSKAELEQAVANLEGQLQVSQSSSFGRAALLRNIELFRLSDEYGNGFAGLYRTLGPKDLLEVAKRRLDPKTFVTLTVEP